MSFSKLHRAVLQAFVLVLLTTSFAACNKEKPTKVLISVKMEDGSKVAGAEVKLFANPAVPAGDYTRLNKTAVTDLSGVAEFDYTDFYEQGQSGFAVLDIETTVDTLFGEGIVKILEEETSEETVFLLPTN
ncbi:MAG: hypothetical protein WAR83_15225 [Flavobacteriales bacterium]|nr:hypothetical protein [Flavobacteriales bacterium]